MKHRHHDFPTEANEWHRRHGRSFLRQPDLDQPADGRATA